MGVGMPLTGPVHHDVLDDTLDIVAGLSEGDEFNPVDGIDEAGGGVAGIGQPLSGAGGAGVVAGQGGG